VRVNHQISAFSIGCLIDIYRALFKKKFHLDVLYLVSKGRKKFSAMQRSDVYEKINLIDEK